MVCLVIVVRSIGRTTPACIERGSNQQVMWMWKPSKKKLKARVTEEITKKVTNDIMAMLRDQGVYLRSPSKTPSPVGGRKSSCASASDAVKRDYIDGLEASPDPDTVDLLIEPTPCSLVINP